MNEDLITALVFVGLALSSWVIYRILKKRGTL